MNNLKMFCIDSSEVAQLDGNTSQYEKQLQVLIEKNLETFLGVRFVATEFRTDHDHGGRIDTLGLDENGCPVVIEYKRRSDENIINQGLFYLDWLVTHRGNFEMLVLSTIGQEAAQSVEWSGTRLICIASEFSKYDEHAIKQMNRNIELIQYLKFGEELLALEQINSASTRESNRLPGSVGSPSARDKAETASDQLDRADPSLRELYESLKELLIDLGEDVEVRALKRYFVFKRVKNFACVGIQLGDQKLLAYVKVDPEEERLKEGFTRDVRKIGHFGTGDLEISIRTPADLEAAKELFEQSYQNA